MPGIMLYESGENSIVHNMIKGYARDAIGLFGSQPAMGVVQDNVLVNFESSNRFTQTKDNYVAWNDMSHTNEDSDKGVDHTNTNGRWTSSMIASN